MERQHRVWRAVDFFLADEIQMSAFVTIEQQTAESRRVFVFEDDRRAHGDVRRGEIVGERHRADAQRFFSRQQFHGDARLVRVLVEKNERVGDVVRRRRQRVLNRFDFRWTIEFLLRLFADRNLLVRTVEIDVLREENVGFFLLEKGDATRRFAEIQRANV